MGENLGKQAKCPIDKKAVVLIVEDDPLNHKLCRDVLEAQGYATLSAFDGLAALDLAKRHQPRLIVMDIQLPLLDGFETTRRLKSDPLTRAIPIIALTSYAMKEDAHSTAAAGCQAHITKPIEIWSFLEMVAKHVRG
ncbi:MAG: response regulator [Myxococcota bacterium]|jgi:CheY-like chemotaxis protein|nr:response regulator [Myxococcota bacterium]